MSHVRSSTTTEIIKGATVPVNDAYIPLDGKLVLQTNDSIKANVEPTVPSKSFFQYWRLQTTFQTYQPKLTQVVETLGLLVMVSIWKNMKRLIMKQ